MAVSRLARMVGVAMAVVGVMAMAMMESCVAEGGLSTGQMDMFSQNNITFYDPSACVSVDGGGFSSSVCGSTAEAKYWSVLSKYFDDPIKVAGVMANDYKEGNFNPVSWQCGNGINRTGRFVNSGGWNYYYNLNSDVGVGSLGITSGLNTYLHYVNDNAPNLIEYFKNPVEYSYNWCYYGDGHNGKTSGDDLLNKIGESNYDALVDLELTYAMEHFNNARTNEYKNMSFSSPSEAAMWWGRNWEKCYECGYGGGSRQLYERAALAEKYYDERQRYMCDGGNLVATNSGDVDGLSAADVTSPDITLIGDSIAMQSEKELMAKFPNGFFSKVGSRHSTSAGKCPGDEGGLSVLQKLSSGSGTVINQHWTGDCESVVVSPYSLTKNVVWELGTNTGGANADTISEVINIIGNDRNLFLVTPYNGQRLDESGKIADLYRKTAEDNSNVYIIDWRAAVENEPSKYVKTEPGMTVHPTDEGKKLLADLIYQAVTGEGMTGVADCNASVTGTAGQAIAETAIRMSWPEGTDRSKWYHNSGVPEEFTKMAEKWGYDGYPSCSRFASMVILESGVDEEFESILRPFGSRKNNLYTLEKYFANSPNWQEVSYEESQPGDIIINHEHVEVYIGDEKKAHAGEVGSPSPLDNNGPHIDPLSQRDKYGDYKWYRSTNSSGTISVSGSSAGCNVCGVTEGGSSSMSMSGEIGENGLSYEDAITFMKRYGKDENGVVSKAVGKDGTTWNNSCCFGGGGSNCVTFSAFFINKFTESKRGRGDGYVTVNNMSHVEGKGQEPRIWAVFSGGRDSPGHTGVILGKTAEGEWIVGHASCANVGTGEGDGLYKNGGCSKAMLCGELRNKCNHSNGAGFVIKSADLKKAMLNYSPSNPGFAYPKNVDVAAIKKFIETGE